VKKVYAGFRYGAIGRRSVGDASASHSEVATGEIPVPAAMVSRRPLQPRFGQIDVALDATQCLITNRLFISS
jgi:hypothetical protein